MENNKETVEINEENIQKALNYLKLDINPFSKRDNLEKSIEEEKPKEEAEEKEKEKEPEDKKEESEEKQPDKPIEEETKKEDIIEKTEIKKSLEEIAENLKPFDDTLQKSILNKVETLEKSVLERLEETTEKLQKAEELNSQLNETIISLQKSIGEGFNTLIDKFKAVGELEQRHLEAIQKQNERIANIDSTPVRRSITSKDFVQKSFDEEKGNKENSNKLSISKNRKDIIKILRQKSKIDEVDDLKKANGDYLTALQSYEASNTLTKAIREDLLKSENIEIIG